VSGCALVIAIDRVKTKLHLAQSLGATHVIDTSEVSDIAAAIRQIIPRGVDYIVDSAGVPALITASLSALARLGTLGLVAVPPSADRRLEVPWFSMLLQGQIVQGFTEGNSVPDLFIPQMIDLYAQGRFPFDKLIRLYPFDQINKATEDLHAGSIIKAVLEMEVS
jgi:aryl-alcohol dehydrogenase